MAPELLDATPYTDEQLDTIRRISKLTEGVYKPYDKDGVQIKIRPGRFGNVAELKVDGFDWMQTNGIDFLDHSVIESFHGNVLLTGLGLGLGVLIAQANPNVTSVTVFENDIRVIESQLWAFAEADIFPVDADYWPNSMEFKYDCAYLDHHKTSIPDEVRKHYESFCTRVVTWYDEYQKEVSKWL